MCDNEKATKTLHKSYTSTSFDLRARPGPIGGPVQWKEKLSDPNESKAIKLQFLWWNHDHGTAPITSTAAQNMLPSINIVHSLIWEARDYRFNHDFALHCTFISACFGLLLSCRKYTFGRLFISRLFRFCASILFNPQHLEYDLCVCVAGLVHPFKVWSICEISYISQRRQTRNHCSPNHILGGCSMRSFAR